MNRVEAPNSATDVMLERDPSVVLLGEDIGYFGGVFHVTEDLQKTRGALRGLRRLVEMSTDKAAVEVPSPVSGRLVSVAGAPGDAVVVGAELAVFETGDETSTGTGVEDTDEVEAPPGPGVTPSSTTAEAPRNGALPAEGAGRRVMASPSAPGPAAVPDPAHAPGRAGDAGLTEFPVIGIRRVIAQRVNEAKRSAPHGAHVDDVDVTALETLRRHLNTRLSAGLPPLTYLPFVVAARVSVLAGCPQCNAHFDAARNRILRHRTVHVGIATQTPDGPEVPVVRDAGPRSP